MSSGGADSRANISLERVQGGSVWFNVTQELEGDPEAQLEEIEWRFGSDITYRRILRVGSGGDPLTWVSLQDKYKHRARVPSMRSLLIQNLTPEDSGQYRARASFTGGRGFTQVFHLSVYEPVPLPQIQAKSLSITADWCNVTLECRAQGASDDLNVTWWHNDLPRKWQQRGTLGPGPSTWLLAVSLPLEQPNTSLTCAVSNQVDLKTATTTLVDVCAHRPAVSPPALSVPPLGNGYLTVSLPSPSSLSPCEGNRFTGTGHWSLRAMPRTCCHGRTADCGSWTVLLEDTREEEGDGGWNRCGTGGWPSVREDDICYAELSQEESQEGGDKGVCEQPLEEKIPVTTIYSEVHRPGQAAKVI
ncbi:SLAM family member 5-like isoform X2 [Rhinolophus sinicus]